MEVIPCRLCGVSTTMFHTRLCDSCWEVERRAGRRLSAPALRAKPNRFLAFLLRLRLMWDDCCWQHSIYSCDECWDVEKTRRRARQQRLRERRGK